MAHLKKFDDEFNERELVAISYDYNYMTCLILL